MLLNEYQSDCLKTRIYDEAVWSSLSSTGQETHARYLKLQYAITGLVGEAGELANQLKKILRDDNMIITPTRQDALVKELGDVLWYISNVADELGVSLDDVAVLNLGKLSKRQNAGNLQGSGDNR
jgi:NTP pyrophosphatase (non-canonical NTP hydrolase)